MEGRREFIAQLLESGAGAFASAAAGTLVERHPDAASPFGGSAFGGWRDHLAGRVSELAVAVSLGEPRVFAAKLAWARAAFESRRVPLEPLRQSLVALREALHDELPDGADGLLEPYFDAAHRVFEGPAGEAPAVLGADSAHGRIAAAYMRALLEGERERASRLITERVPGELSVRDAYTRVLAPVEEAMGQMWHLGEIGIAEEHFATATTRLVMSQLYGVMDRRERNGKTVLAAATEGNRHDLGVRMVADFFEMDGWRVIELGAGMPPSDLARGVRDFHADLIAVSATLTVHLRAARRLIEALRADPETAGTRVLVGGIAFRDAPELWQRLGADAYAPGPEEAVREGRRLVGLPS